MPLDKAGIRRVQIIVGGLLSIGRATNNKLMVALRAIGSQQSTDTEDTNKAIHQLLDYYVLIPGITCLITQDTEALEQRYH